MFPLTALLPYAILGLLIWAVYGAIWRLYLCPIAGFPGSKLAALTFWYEFYFDVIETGSYVYEIERMHKIYGPIVRINPYELHVISDDLDWISQLYPSVGHEVDKFWWSAGMFASTEMTFGTVSHAMHRRRRAAFGKFFSSAMIRKLEPTIKDLVNSLCSKIDTGLKAGKKINLVHAFSALTQDVVTDYCFDTCRNVLEMDDFGPHYYEWMQIHCSLTPVIKQFPWLIPTLEYLPDWWVKATNPPAWLLRVQVAEYTEQIRRVLLGGHQDTTKHATIFHALKDSPDLPPSEKAQGRLAAEASSFVGAGTLTTAHMLSLTSFMVLENPIIHQRLLTELDKAIPKKNADASLSVLESLPYLNAVINEGLRLSHGTMHRLSRSHPNNTLKFQDWMIPPNTPVGMSPYFSHLNPTVFPRPHEFDPERWLGKDRETTERMRKLLETFGRGSRQCVGERLAYAEIYLTLAYLFRRMGSELKLFETERERDVEFVHDYFVPAPHFHSRGVRVIQA